MVFLALAGQTYYMQVFEVGTPDSTLQLGVTGSRALPPDATLTVDPTGKVNNRTGVATVTGTLHLFEPRQSGRAVEVQLAQLVGRFLITGGGSADVSPCDGQSHPWSVTVPGSNGKFAGGPAHVDALIIGCNAFECARVTASVRRSGCASRLSSGAVPAAPDQAASGGE